MVKLKCTECGGEISLDENREFGFCQYCGTKIFLDKSYNAIKEDKEKNYLDFAISEMKESNFEHSYDLLNKCLEINFKNEKALFLKNICEYYFKGDFYKVASLYKEKIKSDSDNKDFYAYYFSDVLYDFSEEMMYSKEDFFFVFELAKTLIGVKGISVLDYIESFRDKGIEICRLYSGTFSIDKEIFNCLVKYNRIIKSLGGYGMTDTWLKFEIKSIFRYKEKIVKTEKEKDNGIGLFSSLVILSGNIIMFPLKIIGGLLLIFLAICFISILWNVILIIFTLFL